MEHQSNRLYIPAHRQISSVQPEIVPPEDKALRAKWIVLAPLIAVLGTAAALPGVALQELMYGGIAVAWVGAPMIEEALKPSGVYLLLAKWPHALHGQIHTAFLSALGGLAFGLIENVLYLSVYFPEHSQDVVLFRYTAGLTLHTVCSFVAGLGIDRRLIAAANGEIPLFSFRKRFFIAAMSMHAAFNIVVTIVFRDL